MFQSPGTHLLFKYYISQLGGGGIRTCADLTDKILNAILIEPWGFSRSDWNFCLVLNLWNMFITWLGLRGDIKTENRKYLGQCPNKGGGQKCPNFNLENLKTEGGVSIFKKCPPVGNFGFSRQYQSPTTTHPPSTQTQYLLMSHLLLTWFGQTFKGKFLAPLSQLSGHICPVILPNNFWTKSFVVLEFFWLKMLFDHIYHSMWKVGQSIIVCQLASHQPLKPPETKHG